LCPDFPQDQEDQYSLYDDPNFYIWGSNFNYVVNLCHVSAKRKGITDHGCEKDDEKVTFPYIQNTSVIHKFVSQFFNANTIMTGGDMEYIGSMRTSNDFIKDISPANNYLS
jgi:hypothetical protein